LNIREFIRDLQLPLPEASGIFLSRTNSSRVLKKGLDFVDFFGEDWENQAFLALKNRGDLFSTKITIYKYPVEYEHFMRWNGEFQTIRLPEGFVHRFFLDNGRYNFFILLDLQKIFRRELEREVLDIFIRRYDDRLQKGPGDRLILGDKIISFSNNENPGLHWTGQWEYYYQWLIRQHVFNLVFLCFFFWLYSWGGYRIMATRFEFRFFIVYLFLAYLIYSSTDYFLQELYYLREVDLKKQLENNWLQQAADAGRAFEIFKDYFARRLKEAASAPEPFAEGFFSNGLDAAIFNYQTEEVTFSGDLNYMNNNALLLMVNQTIVLQNPSAFLRGKELNHNDNMVRRGALRVEKKYKLSRYRKKNPADVFMGEWSRHGIDEGAGENDDFDESDLESPSSYDVALHESANEEHSGLNWGNVNRFRFLSDEFLYMRLKRSEDEFLVAMTISRFFQRYFTDFLFDGLWKNSIGGNVLMLQMPGVRESFRTNLPELTVHDFEYIYKELHGRTDFMSELRIGGIDYYASFLKTDVMPGYLLLFMTPTLEIESEMAKITRNHSSFQILFFLFSAMLAITLQRMTMKRVNALIQGFRNIKQEDYSFRLDDRGRDEAAKVVQQFNAMVEDLETKRKLMPFVPDIIVDLFRQKKETELGLSGDAVVIFSDIRSFTTISETEDPANVVEMLNSYFTIWQEKVEKYGGVVDRFIGDAISVVYFREASVHYFHNAMQTAVEVYEDLQKLNQQRQAKGEFEIKNGMGIAAGKVSFSIVGNEQKREFLLAGESVLLAETMETASKQGQKSCIIVCDQVYEKTRYNYDFVPFTGLKKPGRSFFELI
jgi:class 3 adenylate cyclase